MSYDEEADFIAQVIALSPSSRRDLFAMIEALSREATLRDAIPPDDLHR
jgi:hypothetical protein